MLNYCLAFINIEPRLPPCSVWDLAKQLRGVPSLEGDASPGTDLVLLSGPFSNSGTLLLVCLRSRPTVTLSPYWKLTVFSALFSVFSCFSALTVLCLSYHDNLHSLIASCNVLFQKLMNNIWWITDSNCSLNVQGPGNKKGISRWK